VVEDKETLLQSLWEVDAKYQELVKEGTAPTVSVKYIKAISTLANPN
jgi:hypothetical protein